MRPTATLALLVVLLVSGCSRAAADPIEPFTAAPPQEHPLGWVERYPAKGPGLVFRVASFTITAAGWEADVEIDNASGVGWTVPGDAATFQRTFGVMLFASGDLEEVDRMNRDGKLPTVRAAETFRPTLSTQLPVGASWSGRMSSRGALPAGSFVRIVFGPFKATSDPPEGMEKDVVWITDHAVKLRP